MPILTDNPTQNALRPKREQARAAGRRLRTIREQLGFSQEHFAEALGMHRVSYSHYEAGRCVIPSTKLAKLARTYGFEVDQVIDPTAPPEDDTTRLIGRMARDLGPAYRTSLQRYAQMLRQMERSGMPPPERGH